MAARPEFAQTNVVSGLLPDSVGGVTDASRRRITMPFAPTLAETHRVLGHEIVHAFQFDIASAAWRRHRPAAVVHRRHGGVPVARLARQRVVAVAARCGAERSPSARSRARAARELSPYLYGHAFWAYLGERFGDDVVEKALKPGKKQRRLKDRMRSRDRRNARRALRRLAGERCAREYGTGARRRRPLEAVEPRAHAAGAVAQSRRHAGGVLLRARSPVARSVPRRRRRPAA